MAGKEPLAKFAAVRTRDPDELRECMSPLYAVRTLEVPRSNGRFMACVNHRELQDVGLSYANYTAAVSATLAHGDFYAQGFGVSGYGEAVVDGKTFRVVDNQGGVGGPGSYARLNYQAGFEHLFLKIKPDALIRKLSMLLGGAVNRSLELRGESNPAALEAQHRLVRFVISELDRSDKALSPLVLAELEQALMVAYLCSNLNNYSDRLNAERPPVAPWQVRRAAEYI